MDNELLEQTNPTEENETPGELFLEEGEETNSSPQEEETEGSSPSERADTATVPLKYNGQVIPLNAKAVEESARSLGVSPEEFIATVQKGMNYEHLKGDVARLREQSARERAVLSQYAALNGMQREEYIRFLEESHATVQQNRQMQALQERYPDANPQLLKELAQRQTLEQRARLHAQERRQADDAITPWREYFAQHPEIEDVSKLDPALIEAVRAGETPLAAEMRLQNEKLKDELAILKKQQENKHKALGNLQSEAAASADDFLAGFAL